MSKQDWIKRAETFARIRAQLRKIFHSTDTPLDVAQIASEFKIRFRYLPSIERRLRELVEASEIRRNNGNIPTYEMVKGRVHVYPTEK